MNKYYITFGFAHKDTKGNSLANCYTIIEAETEQEARDVMLNSPHFGNKNWAFIYDNPITPGVIKYKLSYVPFNQL